MKRYTKNWLFAFTITALSVSCMILAFLLLFGSPKSEHPIVAPEPVTETPDKPQKEYVDIEDNVGAVSFTDDQITELARNMFGLDGFVKKLTVEFADNQDVCISASIDDSQTLLDYYVDLQPYKPVLKLIEDKKIEVTAGIVDDNGLARLDIRTVKVDGTSVPDAVLEPFFEQGDFSKLFNVRYDSIELRDGMLIFNDGVPDVLRY